MPPSTFDPVNVNAALRTALTKSDTELYSLDDVQLGWKNCDWSEGAGMVNMGNTCYLNSTLQALFHVPALVNWLMTDREHTGECKDAGLCIICAMRKTLQASQQRNTHSFRPLLIYDKLQLVSQNLIPGRQEDAHEFLRYLVEAMEKAYLSRFKNHWEFDSKIKETTPLNQILGGYLRSALRCLKCGHVSTTFQHFQDLLVDITKAQTLNEALELYFSKEKLDEELYRCESCQRKVPATKQFSLERAPMVLCIQLKRFSFSGNKISKHVRFRQRLDLTQYAGLRPKVPLRYRLVALVTHKGPTIGCGHYTAVAQAPSGSFYQFDDSTVRRISHQVVFNTNPYIMLYELESSPFARKQATTTSNLEIPCPIPEYNQLSSNRSTSSNMNSNSTAPKTMTNGIDFTSNKVYGPELPPNRLDKKTNGSVPSINGKGKSDSDSDTDSVIKPKAAAVSKTVGLSMPVFGEDTHITSMCKDVKSVTPAIVNTSASPVSSLSSLESTPKKTREPPSIAPTATKSLVPCKSNDTSSSDDSNQSAQEIKSRVSTKAAVGDWQVVSRRGKRSDRKKLLQQQNRHPVNVCC